MGVLEQSFSRIFDLHTSSFLQNNAVRGLSAEDVQLLEADLQQGRAALSFNLNTKLDYWQHLPWHLAGIAHYDEEVARACARQCRNMFDADPREDSHHCLTFSLLQGGCDFRSALDEFCEGSARSDLSQLFLQVIAKFAFMPVVETTVESRHAKVALESQLRLGPVRVSLANRLPLLENKIAREPELLQDLLKHFMHMRHLRCIPGIFNFQGHPHLVERVPERSRPSAYLAPCAAIIYRCNIDSLFESFRHEQHGHDKGTAMRARKRASMVPKQAARPLLGSMALDHFRQLAITDDIFSVPRCAVALQTLADYQSGIDSRPDLGATKKPRLAEPIMDVDMDAFGDLDLDGPVAAGAGAAIIADAAAAAGDEDLPAADKVFFRVVKLNPTEKIRAHCPWCWSQAAFRCDCRDDMQH